MAETGTKGLSGRWSLIAVVIGLAAWAFFAKRSDERPWGLVLGQDLKGGTTLRFSLDIAQARREGRIVGNESDGTIVDQTLEVIETRINRFGLAEVALVPVGEDKFEISLPAEIDPESVKRVVSALGELQFRIEVLAVYHAPPEDVRRTRNEVWTGAKGEGQTFDATPQGFEEFKKKEVERFREAREKAARYVPLDPKYRVLPRERPGAEPGSVPTQVDAFAVVEEPDAGHRFGGEAITNVRAGPDNEQLPGVLYEVKLDYQKDFGDWTEQNVGLPMAIVLNEEFFSAPVIHSRLGDHGVVISLGGGGGNWRDENARREREQKQLVAILQSGSLKIKPVLEATSTVGATLAGKAVERGILSTVVAVALVLLYMVVYYFAAGLIADVALLLNLVLLVGAMAFLDATLTLPGIAGVVLTLGMAVDANILVYERIREEQARGRSVQKAVSEGFDRAFTTIVDSNVTTFFTALFLLWLGAGSIKGFAVTLILGLLASMFTAVYVTRTIFEAWIRSGRLQKIAMLGSGRPPTIRWMRLRKYFIPTSIGAMGVGIVLFAISPRSTVYDIDFTGGMKLQARFDRPTSIEDVKKALDSGERKVRIPKDASRGEGTGVTEVQAGPYGGAEVVTVGGEGDHVEIRAALAEASARPNALKEREQIDALRAYVEQALSDRLVPSWVRTRPAPYKAADDKDEMKPFEGRLAFRIALEDRAGALTAARLETAVQKRMPWYDYPADGRRRESRSPDLVDRTVKVREATGAAGAAVGFVKTYDVWWKADRKGTTNSPLEDDADRLLSDLREFLSSAAFKQALKEGGASESAATQVSLADPFPVSDLIGAGVAKRLRDDAMLALLLSFVAIVVYVAFRFRSYPMGFAAVLCLVHDVLIALGFVCIVDNLGIVDAKISLGLVAAFLTIVGYSVNDTVVTFDRIRELRGKAPRISVRLIEDAVNQTFSRTLRTTATVLLTVIVLFVLNVGQRSMLEGLSFTLLVGIASGGYSTIGVASPLLLFLPWFWAKARKYRPRTQVMTWPIHRTGLWVLLGVAGAATAAAYVASSSWVLALFYGALVAPLGVTVGAWLAWFGAFAVGCFVASSVMLVPWSFHEDPEGAAEEAHRELGLGEAALPELGAPPPASSKGDAAKRDAPRGDDYGRRRDGG